LIAKPTGSKVHRVWKCPASAVLPHDIDDDREAKSEPFRNRGKHLHRFLELVGSIGVESALDTVDKELRPLCRALDIGNLPTHLSTEVSFAYNWRTSEVRELGRNLGHRNYHLLPEPPTDDEIALTIDVCGAMTFTDANGLEVTRGYVGDYKSGWTKYPRPGEYGQTLLGALCVRAMLGTDDVLVELLHIDPDDGDHYTVRDVVDMWALDLFADELRAVMERLPELEEMYAGGVGLALHEGAHCAYCPALKHCDAKVAFVRSIPSELLSIGVAPSASTGELVVATGAVTAARAARAFEVAEKIEAVCKAIKAEVCAIAFHTPVELSDGRIIERTVTSRRVVDGKTAAAVLEQRYGREQAMKAVDLKVSIEAIRDVVVANMDHNAVPKPKIETAKKTGLLDVVLAEIERRGGLATNSSEVAKPKMPKKAKKLGPGKSG
jgi:hypothetical protein